MIANYQSTTDAELEKFMCLDDVEEAQENENLEILNCPTIASLIKLSSIGSLADFPVSKK